MATVDIDDVADELYALAPEDFTAARDAAAKAATDAELRKGIKALRKPTVAAYAVNRLVHERPRDIDALLDVGEQLRRAMGRDAAEVRRLSEERRQLIGALVDPSLAAGVQQDVTATLEAATADPELGAAVRSGRLVKPLRYAGFGALPDLGDALATQTTRPATARPSAPKTVASPKPATPTPKPTADPKSAPASTPTSARPKKTEPDPAALTAARERCLELSGVADDAQRRYERASAAVRAARATLEAAEAERAEAHKAARAAHAEAERARRDLGRLERS
jgi:hypothetical protein